MKKLTAPQQRVIDGLTAGGSLIEYMTRNSVWYSLTIPISKETTVLSSGRVSHNTVQSLLDKNIIKQLPRDMGTFRVYFKLVEED